MGIQFFRRRADGRADAQVLLRDRKSTRLNSSHVAISYAVFCLKNKKPCQKHFCCLSPSIYSLLTHSLKPPRPSDRYTLSLHDALPISCSAGSGRPPPSFVDTAPARR